MGDMPPLARSISSFWYESTCLGPGLLRGLHRAHAWRSAQAVWCEDDVSSRIEQEAKIVTCIPAK